MYQISYRKLTVKDNIIVTSIIFHVKEKAYEIYRRK